MHLTSFQLDRFADQAERDAKGDLIDAEYFEGRAKQLADQAALLRARSERRAAESAQYRADASRAFEREQSAKEIAA